jgi:MFS family permease
MVTAGVLNDIVRSLQVSVALGGQLVGAAAAVMAVGSPLMAAALSGWDLRKLLVLALLWFGAGHAVSALMPSYAALLPVRCLCMLGAAAFTPQAAAAISALTPAAERGRAITFVFLGWSVASVLGMPISAYIGETWGWRWAFVLVALLSLLAAAGVWRALPHGIRPAALSRADWQKVLTHPLLMGIVLVTAMSSAGQFTLFSYFAPYYSQVLGASAAQISLLFLCFGAVGLVGNVLLTHTIDRIGAATAVALALAAGGGRGQCAADPHALGAGLLLVELGPAGTAGTGCAGAGHGVDLAELLGHVPGPVRRCGQRRRDDRHQRLCRAQLGGAGMDERGAVHQPVGRAAHARRRACLSRKTTRALPPCACRNRRWRSSASSTGWRCRALAACWPWRSASWWNASVGSMRLSSWSCCRWARCCRGRTSSTWP